MFFSCYNNLSNHKTPKQKARKPFDFRCSLHGIFPKFKNKNVSTRRQWMSEREERNYLWRYNIVDFQSLANEINGLAISLILLNEQIDLWLTVDA